MWQHIILIAEKENIAEIDTIKHGGISLINLYSVSFQRRFPAVCWKFQKRR